MHPNKRVDVWRVFSLIRRTGALHNCGWRSEQREACGHPRLSDYKSELCYRVKLARLCHY